MIDDITASLTRGDTGLREQADAIAREVGVRVRCNQVFEQADNTQFFDDTNQVDKDRAL